MRHVDHVLLERQLHEVARGVRVAPARVGAADGADGVVETCG